MRSTTANNLMNKIAELDRRLFQLERLRAQPQLSINDLVDTPGAPASNSQSLTWSQRNGVWLYQSPRDIPFSYAGLVVASTSPPYTPPFTTNITGIAVSVGTAASTDTTIALNRTSPTHSPVAILTVTFPAGATYTFYPMPITTPSNFNARMDQMSVTATPGTGLADLVVTAEPG